MEGCPFDSEVWATLTVLGHKGWEDKPYSKAFCFDCQSKRPDEQAGLVVARARGIPIVGYQRRVIWTERYPIYEVKKRFGLGGFWNDMSYMIALALYKGYKSLLLYGVDQGPEVLYQGGRPFTTFWLGVATGMGVRWELSPNSILWRKSF